MDLLTRAALHRARSALDMVDGGPHTPHAKPFPWARLVGIADGQQGDLPREVYDQTRAFSSRGVGPQRGGHVRPIGDFLGRDITASTATGTAKGGNLIGDSKLPVGRELAQPSVVIEAGARTLTIDSQASLPVLDTPPTASWVAENTAPSQATPTFALRSVTPKTAVAWVNVSRRARLQSSVALDIYVEQALRRAIARAIDTAALGTGGGDTPTGIVGTSGVNTVSLGTSGALTRAKIGELFQSVADDGGLDAASTPAIILPTAVAGKLFRTEAASGSGYLFDWDGRGATGRCGGFTAYVTNSAPTQTVVFGDFSRLLLAFFGGAEVVVDPRPVNGSGTFRVGVFVDVAVVVEQPGAFSFANSVNVS